MHITEGIITGAPAVAYTGVGLALVGWGAARMKKFVARSPENKPLLGMAGALIFFVSLIPIPAFTGTCTHPCGTPLVAILLGPAIGTALAGISLLLQAAFFAHGGFGTWGANVVSLGFLGCLFGWGGFRLARRLGMPLWAAGFIAGFIGDLMVYAGSGFILGTTLARAPAAQYSLSGYLAAIYLAYLPTQLPIAVGEMLLTGLAVHFAYKRRPEVLAELGLIGDRDGRRAKAPPLLLLLVAAGLLGLAGTQAAMAQDNPGPPPSTAALTQTKKEPGTLAGMDEAVNERMAAAAARPPRDPYLNIKAMGDLWNSLLLLAGGICGFIIGRWWPLLWGKPAASDRNDLSARKSPLLAP